MVDTSTLIGAGTFEAALPDEAATVALGQDLAMALQRGDAVCLYGPLGAGKSTLARAIIRKLAGDDRLEVPSPTYLLCQDYALDVHVRHFDLYRLADAGELDELGMEEELGEGITLIEWPELAAGRLPANLVSVRLAIEGGNRRHADIACGGTTARRVGRSLEIRQFLDASWGPGAERRFLQGDASTRRYEVAQIHGETRIVMDALRQPDGPPIRDGRSYSQIARLAEDVIPFVAMARALREVGLAAPQVHAQRLERGLLLTEHLGNGSILDGRGRPIPDRYRESARLLAELHARPWPECLPYADDGGKERLYRMGRYDREPLLIEVSLFSDWYAPHHLGEALSESATEAFLAVWTGLLREVTPSLPSLVLRDFHSPNIIWRDAMPFPGRIGLIDFQDALIGPRAYDVASLAQDARVDIEAPLERSIVETYVEAAAGGADFDRAAFSRDYAVLAAQRATKILGIFVRLNVRDGKPAYLAHLPRMIDYLRRSLGHPALAAARAWYAENAGIHALTPGRNQNDIRRL